MKKKKAIEILKEIKYQLQISNKQIENDIYDNEIFMERYEEQESEIYAIETALQALENSIPKEVIKEKINEINDEARVRNTPDNNEWYIESGVYAYAEEKLQELLEGE